MGYGAQATAAATFLSSPLRIGVLRLSYLKYPRSVDRRLLFEELRQAALLREQLATDRVLRVLGQGRSYVDVVAEHSEQACALPEQDSSEYFKTASVIAPNWNPQITVRSLELARANEPGAFVRLISPMPLLMLVA